MKMMHGYNVDWNLKNDDGRSPMLDALYSKKQPNPNIFGAAAHFGADIYTTNEFGENVLHVAIENEHLDLVDNFLRQRNPFRNLAKEKDIFGMTPLDLADDIGVLKPKSAIFEKALSEAGCDAAKTVYIGDRVDTDAHGAMALGMGFIQMATLSRHKIDDFEKSSWPVFQDFHQVASYLF